MKTTLYLVLLLSCMRLSAQTKKWTLRDCVQYAIENNIAVKQSEMDVKTAEVNLRGAKGNFLPNLNVNMRHSWNIGLNTNPVTNTNLTATTQTSIFGLSAGITLYDGLKNSNRLHKANLAILANQYQLEDMKDNISLRVVNAYLQILFSKESLGTLKKQAQLNIKERKQTEELVNLGSKPKGELLEIEASIASQEQQIVNAENTLKIAKLTLANLLLIKDADAFEIADQKDLLVEAGILDYNSETIYDKAVQNRNDIKASALNVEISETNVKIAKGNYQPTLSGSYGFNTNYYFSKLLKLPNFETQIADNKGHAFGLNLSIPIFNRFANSNDVRRAEINHKKAQLALRQSKVDLKDKVNQAHNDLKGALAAYKAALKTGVARKEAFRYSQNKFELGLLNSFDFQQAKTRLEMSENDLIQAKYDFFFKAKVLEFYFGIPFGELQI